MAAGSQPRGPARVIPAHATPRSVGRYRLCFELASGGMATMYLARAEGPAGFEKLVALKRIHPHLSREQEFVEMFLDEARIASRINHPNVCSVFDFGEAGGSYYIAMEYVHGETLGSVLRRVARDIDELSAPRYRYIAARIVAEAAEGLHAAHELTGDGGLPLGVVHRDVSPQNLFVAYDGTVRVVDFGIARAEGRLHQTRTGTVKGKLAYLAPEQARKKSLDRRIDVWALGVVLWELLVGKRLFQRETDAETVLAVVTDPIHPPSKIRKWLPKELDAIVMRALSRDPAARYPSARELGRDLHRFISRSEDPPTSADLADWMDHLFANEKVKRAELIEQARRSQTGPVARIDLPTLNETSASDVRAFDPEQDVSDGTAEPPVAALPPSTEPTETLEIPTGITEAEVLIAPPSAEIVLPPGSEVGSTQSLAVTRPGSGRRFAWMLGTAIAAGIGIGIAFALVSNGEPARLDEPMASVPTPPMRALPGAPAPEPTLPIEPEPEPEPVQPALADPEPAAPEAPPVPERQPEHARVVVRDRSPPPPRAEPGRVSIATPGGWAEVFSGSRRLGRAPGEVTLPAGRSVLTLRPFGTGSPRRVTVNVPAGGSTRVVVPIAH